jgi:hypothetical protein
MRSDLKRIVARLEALQTTRRTESEEQRILAEPGESRYQRRSANIKQRVAAIEFADDSVHVDLTEE